MIIGRTFNARNLGFLKRGVASVSIDHGSLPEHRSLMIEQYGDPTKNVILKTRKPSEVLPRELGPKDILVEHLAACINPADLNLIQGVYGIQPKLPTILGNEGVTKIKAVGPEITHLKPGDIALGVSLIGYWQNYSVQNGSDFYRVDGGLDLATAAQLKVNPCTAYRMIKDFCALNPGDTIIQNGANSAVGVYVIQLAKLWGFKTINVIRDRPDKDEVVQELKDFGADFVLTESEVGNVEIVSPILKEIGKPRLFLNCVCGKNAINCQKTLDHGGHYITYGAMSKQPVSTSASALIFKDHVLRGFWVSRWYSRMEKTNRDEVQAMLDEVGKMFKQGDLKPKSTIMIDFQERNAAFGGSNNAKFIFKINKK